MAVEKEYENVVTMANGTKAVTNKTAEGVAADAADETSFEIGTTTKKRKTRRAHQLCQQSTSINSTCIHGHPTFCLVSCMHHRPPNRLHAAGPQQHCNVKSQLRAFVYTRLLARVSQPVVEQSSVSVIITRWSHRPSTNSTTDSVTF